MRALAKPFEEETGDADVDDQAYDVVRNWDEGAGG